MNSLQKIGEKIKDRRKVLNIGQETLADFSGVGITTISNLENGKGNITIETLDSLFEILGLELSINIKQMI